VLPWCLNFCLLQRLPDGVRLRGDIHALLLGDPSTAKSQASIGWRIIAYRLIANNLTKKLILVMWTLQEVSKILKDRWFTFVGMSLKTFTGIFWWRETEYSLKTILWTSKQYFLN
jgi:hypothetical protein